MATIRAFHGFRPQGAEAKDIIAPPYDVLSREEARAILSDRPSSFLRVTRPDAHWEDGVEPSAKDCHERARDELQAMILEGALRQDLEPSLYLYGQRMGAHHQVGLMALCSVEEYDRSIIKKHEYTRPDKEQDRVDHILTTGAQTGLVFLAYRQTEELLGLLAVPETEPLFSVTTEDGVDHTLWRLSDPDTIQAIEAGFGRVQSLYIADGHHRSAAASRVAAQQQGEGAHDWFLAGIFPDDQLQVLPYNRLVHDLAGHSVESFMAALREHFTVRASDSAQPADRGQIQMYLDGGWWSLLRRDSLHSEDPVEDLDVAVLQNHVLGPLLKIEDPRRSKRISFVGGIRGTDFLRDAVEQGRAAVAFSMHPTQLGELFAVADSGQVMPPKSTWFEPKLRGGVLLHRWSS